MKKRSLTYAAAALMAGAGVSVALACCGAETALAWMARRWAAGLVGAAAAVCAARAAFDVRDLRARSFAKAAFLFHLGTACVLGGWAVNGLCGGREGSARLFRGMWTPVEEAFELRLRDFTIDRWPDTGTVRQYTSVCDVWNIGEVPDTPDRRPELVAISVNHPLVRRGWWVYQSSYQEMTNPHTGAPVLLPVLLCVRDVGLPLAAAGALLLLAGALVFAVRTAREAPPRAAGPPPPRKPAWLRALYALASAGALAMLVHRAWTTGHPPMQNMYEFLMCAAAFVPVLTWVSARADGADTLGRDAFLQTLVLAPVCFFMDGQVRRLMPALQSPFFVPHVGAYVLGYILLVRAALGAGVRLAGTGFFFLTVGLVLGAVWGKVCWGHWWQFDPKEMWSLATWLVYAAYFHLRPRLTPRGARAFLVLGAVMIVLTLTWINLSRLFTGMHSYA